MLAVDGGHHGGLVGGVVTASVRFRRDVAGEVMSGVHERDELLARVNEKLAGGYSKSNPFAKRLAENIAAYGAKPQAASISAL